MKFEPRYLVRFFVFGLAAIFGLAQAALFGGVIMIGIPMVILGIAVGDQPLWVRALLEIVVVAGLVWIGRRWFLNRRKGKRVAVALSEDGVDVCNPDGTHSNVCWTDLVEVGILTTSDGPWAEDVFWILIGEHNKCVVPGEHGNVVPGEHGNTLLHWVGRLPRFDHEQVIRAMASTSEARFVCWKGLPGEARDLCSSGPQLST